MYPGTSAVTFFVLIRCIDCLVHYLVSIHDAILDDNKFGDDLKDRGEESEARSQTEVSG